MNKFSIVYKNGVRIESEARMLSIYPHNQHESKAMLIVHHEGAIPSEYIMLEDVHCITILLSPKQDTNG